MGYSLPRIRREAFERANRLRKARKSVAKDATLQTWQARLRHATRKIRRKLDRDFVAFRR